MCPLIIDHRRCAARGRRQAARADALGESEQTPSSQNNEEPEPEPEPETITNPPTTPYEKA